MAQMAKNPSAMQETWVQSLGWEDPLEEGMATHSHILPREFHGHRSLAGYSPQGCKESDTTKATEHTYISICWGLIPGPFMGIKSTDAQVSYV